MRVGFPQIIVASFVVAIAGFFIVQQISTPVVPQTNELTVQEQLGFALVTSYCADCHAVGKTGNSLHAAAPKFRQLHALYDVTFLEEALVEGLVAHPDMPEFEFDAPQTEAIIQYLKALETH